MSSSRPSLSQADFLRAAIELADEEDLSAVTMRALGERLGVDPTAVYRHFPTKESLLDAMLDNLLAEVVATPIPEGLSPRDAIAEMAHVSWSVFQAHPNMPGAFVTASGNFPNGLTYLRRVVAHLRDMGLKGDDVVECFQLLESYVIGFSVMNTGGRPSTWSQRQLRYRFFDQPEFDAVARDEELVRDVAHRAFDTGLNSILDECERRARANRS